MSVDNVITEWLIDGAWTAEVGGVDLDERVRKNPGVRVSRGVSDQQAQPTAASSDFHVNNADGIFSNRNPSSPLYRKIPRYTQVRHRIPTAAGSMDNYVLSLRPDEAGSCSTTDKAGLEITGDIDIRFEITPDTWAPLNGYAVCGRYNLTSNNRSWLVWMDYAAQVVLRWSTDGANTNTRTFDALASGQWGRRAVRITLDVDNGAGGHTATMYLADSIAGPWVQWDQVVTAGTTSIYGSSNAALELCDVGAGSPITGQTMMYGKFHAFELRNGINGTVVAALDVADEDIGTTSWADAYGNTWTLTGTTRVGSDRIRHTGELDSIEYDADPSLNDVWLPLRTIGPLNRMQEAGTPIGSALARAFNAYPLMAGRWRLEDGPDATKALGEGTSVNTSVLTDCTFTGSVPSGLAGSSGSLRLNSTSSSAWLGTAGREGTGENSIIFCFKLPSLPASNTTLVTMTGNGTIRRWDFRIGPVNIGLNGYNLAGTQIVAENALFGTGVDPSTGWVMFQLSMSQEGGNVRYTTRWAGIGTSTWKSHTAGGNLYAGSVGLVGVVLATANGESAFAGAEFAHVINSRDSLVVNTTDFSFYNAALGWAGEDAASRAARLADEEGIDLEIYGELDDSQLMGPQTADTPYNLLNDCARVDGALLFDLRDRFAIGYRTRVDMENQNYSNWHITLAHSELAQVPRPIEDSRYTKNDFTASRPGGGSGRARQLEGPLSVSEPPDGIGPRVGGDSYNGYTDDQMQRLAEYQVFLRTRDEMRIPQLVFELHRTQLETTSPETLERVVAAHLGDWVTLLGLPTFIDPVLFKYLMVLGYVEQFNGHLWNISFNTITADGFRVPRAEFIYAADDGTTVLKTGVLAAATSITLKTPTTSRPWIYSSHSEWPGSVQAYIAGELVTMTAIGTPSIVSGFYEQTATITRAGNDVSKDLDADEVIEFANPHFLGLD